MVVCCYKKIKTYSQIFTQSHNFLVAMNTNSVLLKFSAFLFGIGNTCRRQIEHIFHLRDCNTAFMKHVLPRFLRPAK